MSERISGKIFEKKKQQLKEKITLTTLIIPYLKESNSVRSYTLQTILDSILSKTRRKSKEDTKMVEGEEMKKLMSVKMKTIEQRYKQ